MPYILVLHTYSTISFISKDMGKEDEARTRAQPTILI